jgi:hypothetical protein
MAIIKKNQTTTNADEDTGEKGTPIYYWWECKLVQSVASVLEFP